MSASWSDYMREHEIEEYALSDVIDIMSEVNVPMGVRLRLHGYVMDLAARVQQFKIDNDRLKSALEAAEATALSLRAQLGAIDDILRAPQGEK